MAQEPGSILEGGHNPEVTHLELLVPEALESLSHPPVWTCAPELGCSSWDAIYLSQISISWLSATYFVVFPGPIGPDTWEDKK